jgi:MGT family glycosyltransferase
LSSNKKSLENLFMTHFGVLSGWSPGHLNPIFALAYELKQRDHQITAFNLLDVEAKAVSAKISFCALGESEFPKRSLPKMAARLGQMKGLSALRQTVKDGCLAANVFLRDAPGAIKKAGVEVLLIDQAWLEGETIAEILDIPFISVCGALMFNAEISVPPNITTWNYDPSWLGLLRNLVGYSLLYYPIVRPIIKTVNQHRQLWKLPPYSFFSTNPYSKLLQLSQQPAEFEFPRRELPSVFHFTGPYSNPASREPVPFPYEKLTGQPLIYASMGTLQNRLLWVFQMIAEACVELDVQLVIALGGGTSPESLPEFPGNTIVVGYAPQLELLQRATLTITHAGMNTTLESLSNGVPMVAIPISQEQPGIAARIAWTGTGEVVTLSRLSVPRLRAAIQRVLTEDSYRKNALRMHEAIRRAGGVSRAADLIEQVVSKGKPILREEYSQVMLNRAFS